jgi:cytochrome c oxidase cbb3-type subunit 3
MKFINYLEKITGVGVYPLSSLIIFFIFFTSLLVYILNADKQYLKDMENMPLSGDDNL